MALMLRSNLRIVLIFWVVGGYRTGNFVVSCRTSGGS